jgi:tripartite-type tricarboxylate transporter receptor subunit TctC
MKETKMNTKKKLMTLSGTLRHKAQASVLAWCCVLSVAAIAAVPARAEVFPSHPIKFVVPFAPGSVTDVAARYYAKRLTDLGGQPVIVENRPGANGLIGVQAVLNAPADGYSVLVGTTSTLAVNVALYRKLPYDPLADFAPLSTMTAMPTIIVAPKDTPYKSTQELVKAAKANPNKLNYAAGATSYHLMAQLFNETSGIATTYIPYKGSSEALRATIGKEVDFGVMDASTALGPIKSGTLQGLAVASEKRLALLPDLPTATEAGINGYVASTWVAAVVSSKTPKPVLSRLQELMTRIANERETYAFFNNIGVVMMPAGPDALRTLMVDSVSLWKRVATNAKIELQ